MLVGIKAIKMTIHEYVGVDHTGPHATKYSSTEVLCLDALVRLRTLQSFSRH